MPLLSNELNLFNSPVVWAYADDELNVAQFLGPDQFPATIMNQ